MAKPDDDLPIVQKKSDKPKEFDKYDDQLTKVMVSLGADGAFLMIFGTEEQTGSSFVAKDGDTYGIIRAHLPDILRKIADAIEQANTALILSGRSGKN